MRRATILEQDNIPATPMRAGHKEADLLPNRAIACIERWSLSNNGLIEHQDNGALPCRQAPFEPPFACRHVAGRRARPCRGRFHRRPKWSMAKLTPCRETPRW